MWDVFKVKRMMMMFAGYCVCGAGTKQDFLVIARFFQIHYYSLNILARQIKLY